MPEMQVNSMYSALKPLFMVSKVLGLAPFKITPEKAVGCSLGTVWAFVVLIILTTFSVISISQRPRKQYNSLMLSVGDDLSVYMDVFGMTLSILCGVFYRNSIIQTINLLVSTDQDLKRFSYVSDLQKIYKKYQKIVTVLTASLTIYFVTYIIVNIATYLKTFTVVFFGNVLAYVWPTVTYGMIELQFCVFAVFIKKRLVWLNEQMSQVGKILWKPNYGDQDPVAMIMKTKYFHQRLCEITELINKTYSFQLLFMLTALFLNSIMTLFYWAIQSVPENKTKIFIADIIYMNNKFFFGVLQILVLVYVCSSTVREAKRTSCLIHDIMPPSSMLQNREALQIQLSCFSLQLANHNIEFNACGVFSINESLIYSIIGAASAYLVIVIQFELSSNAALGINNTTVTAST